MSKIGNYFSAAGSSWQLAWQEKKFRTKVFIGIFLLTSILICLPFFFQFIEKRKGYRFNDMILTRIPAYNVYILIFILVWSNALLMLRTVIKKPSVFLTFLYAYIFLFIARALTIFSIPLETPPHIITLADPLANYFYGVSFITKDLFFSGHVSTLFVIYLCQVNRYIKFFTLISCICVSILVLVQHIHYSIDVIFAFPFAYICYRSAKYITI